LSIKTVTPSKFTKSLSLPDHEHKDTKMEYEKKSKITKKKLIYVLTSTYFDSKKRGFSHTLNKTLVKSGFQIKTITCHRPGELIEETLDSVLIKRFRYLPEKYEVKFSFQEEIRKSKLGFLKSCLMTISFFAHAFFECLKKRPDFFIGRWAFPSGYIAYILSKIFKKKCIIEIYGSEVTLTKNSKWLQKLLIPCMNNSSLIIANSNYTKNEFIKMGVEKEKIIKIGTPPNYVKHTSDSKFLNEFRKKFADDSYKIILFVGHLIELKGVEYAIRALQHIVNKKTHLIIAGDGIQRNELNKLTKSLGLENQVTFFGPASLEQVGWLHDISDVFVCPPIIDSKGFTENLCKVIPEAMESGLPVVATNVGGVPEIVVHQKTGLLVEQKDPIGLANAIDEILTDNDLRNRIIENSKLVVDEFSHEKLEEKYINSINKAIKLDK